MISRSPRGCGSERGAADGARREKGSPRILHPGMLTSSIIIIIVITVTIIIIIINIIIIITNATTIIVKLTITRSLHSTLIVITRDM